jgi:hypothetical protein
MNKQNKPLIDKTNREKSRKALPKSKSLANNVWNNRGGESYGTFTPGCHSLIKSCQC